MRSPLAERELLIVMFAILSFVANVQIVKLEATDDTKSYLKSGITITVEIGT